ncbi:MAG: HNH endonuclease [Flavobacteriales bacterium]
MPRKDWTWDEMLLAFNLYCRLPFGKLDQRTQEVRELAGLIGRTPSSVAMKLGNIARLDPTLQKRGIKGLSRGGKMEKEVWDYFETDWEELIPESQRLLEEYQRENEPNENKAREKAPSHYGATKERKVSTRVGQNFFRQAVLAAYGERCCITGLDDPNLLIASHIVPWKDDEAQRMNPRNGLCLNALHDKAFDRGLLRISREYRVELAPALKERKQPAYEDFFHRYDGASIRLPERFPPDPELLSSREGVDQG